MQDECSYDYVCPVCRQYKFAGAFDICEVCFWENDDLQCDDAELSGGANRLCLNDYRKWWQTLEEIMPKVIEECKIQFSKDRCWKYDGLIVPRENIKQFVNEMTSHNIEVRASFYYLCEQYHYNFYTFVGFLPTKSKTVGGRNNEILDLVFTDDPVNCCKKYRLKQVLEIIEHSKDIMAKWREITPHLCIMPNPTTVPV